MTQSFRRLKDRIRSVDNTRKITRAMGMVSASKLNRVKGALASSKPYFADLERVLSNLASDMGNPAHPLLEKRGPIKNIALMVIASDTGLCSVYNYNIIKLAEEFAAKFSRDRIKLVTVGKEAFSFFGKEGYAVENSYLGLGGKISESVVSDIACSLTGLFLTGGADEICIAYTRFKPNLKHEPVVEKFLPVEYIRAKKQYYISEPGKEAILNELISKYLLAKIRMVFLDALTAEHSARMLAMKLATDNADELIDTLTLMKNKARQAAITKEVLEIAMSAEALKG